MTADRHATDALDELTRLLRAVEDLHTLVVSGQPVTPSTTHALVLTARVAHYHASRAHVASTLFPERRLPHAETITLPDRMPPSVREFVAEHPELVKESAK